MSKLRSGDIPSGPARLGTRITLSVAAMLILILLGAAAIFIYYEYAFFKQNVRDEAERTLNILEALHTQAMLQRGNSLDDNPVVATLNGTFEQLTRTSKTMSLWLVMSPKVLAHQERSGALEREPPKDDIDREAIAMAATVARMAGQQVFRLTRPVILGEGVAADNRCFPCHKRDMGLGRGEVIGAFSIALSVADGYEQLTATVRGAILISIVAALLVAAASAYLLKRVASDPITNITRVMGRLAEGDVEVEIPGQSRRDEIGEMARSVQVFKEQAIAARQHERELAMVSRRAVMGELASALAHELAQPLATINAYCNGVLARLRSGKWTTQEITEVAQKASAMNERATAILRRIADHVRGTEPEMTPIAINEIVRSITPIVEADARNHGVRLMLELANDTAPVLADRVEIENVIVNLARNAVEAMAEHGIGRHELTISTLNVDEGTVEVVVGDTGPQIPDEVRERMFEPFFTTKRGGMGMGLAICRTTVEAHGGRMWVLSGPDRGASIHFTLPTIETAPAAEKGSDSANV